jgi:tetratricopeptide (TPR) repeat protein
MTRKVEEVVRAQSEGRLVEALALCRDLLLDEPMNAQLRYLAGNLAVSIGEHSSAVDHYFMLVEIAPDVAEGYTRLGLALERVNRFEEALDAQTAALRLAPTRRDVLAARARLLQKMGRFELALDDAKSLVTLGSDAAAFVLQGAILLSSRRWAEALEAFDAASTHDPSLPEVWYNRAIALQFLEDYGSARDSLDRALALRPLYPEANWNLALLLLAEGDFERGLPLYEARWLLPGFVGSRGFPRPYPRWTGAEPLTGKKILVHFEQGYGDTVQFVRYLPMLKERGAIVVLHAPSKLLKVFSSLVGVDRVTDSPAPEAKFDYQIPLLSLPLALGGRVGNIPWSDPGYLRAHTSSVIKWRNITKDLKRPRIGLMWVGNRHPDAEERSLKLADFAPLFQLPQLTFISLQPELVAEDREYAEGLANFHHYDGMHEDFSDAAALIDLVDLVISVDTSVGHLAGAMGKPVWILLPKHADWRWFRDRADTPWYPSASLFRQQYPGAWDSVVDQVRGRLIDLFPVKKRWWAVLGSNQ